MLPWKTLANNDILLVFIIDFWAKKLVKLKHVLHQNSNLMNFLMRAPNCLQKFAKAQKICQITACDVQNLTIMVHTWVLWFHNFFKKKERKKKICENFQKIHQITACDVLKLTELNAFNSINLHQWSTCDLTNFLKIFAKIPFPCESLAFQPCFQVKLSL